MEATESTTPIYSGLDPAILRIVERLLDAQKQIGGNNSALKRKKGLSNDDLAGSLAAKSNITKSIEIIQDLVAPALTRPGCAEVRHMIEADAKARNEAIAKWRAENPEKAAEMDAARKR